MQPNPAPRPPTSMLYGRKKPSPDPALENEFRRKMGRDIKPKEVRWIELADKALSEPRDKNTDDQPVDQGDKAA